MATVSDQGRGKQPSADRPTWRDHLRRFAWLIKAAGIATLFAVGVTVLLLYPILPSRHPYNVQVGDIASEDIRAPRTITYVSQIETEAARVSAAAAIGDVYDPPDPRVGRQQVRKAHEIMDFVRDVRADPVSS